MSKFKKIFFVFILMILVFPAAAQAEKEIEYLQEYLPKQLTDEELKGIIMETIETVGASSMKDMGKVMGIVNPKVKGRAESAKVAAIVKDELM